MANINVQNLLIENGENQILGDPFTVTVHVNNRESVIPGSWKSTYCHNPGDGDSPEYTGHGANVEVKLLRNGAVVASKEEDVCAPLVASGKPDPMPSWDFEPTETGEYDVRATVTPKGNGPSDTETRTIEVVTTGQQQPADDGGGGLTWHGDADGDGTPNYRDPQPRNPEVPGNSDPLNLGSGIDKAALIVALLAIAWLASSASNTVEAVT